MQPIEPKLMNKLVNLHHHHVNDVDAAEVCKVINERLMSFVVADPIRITVALAAMRDAIVISATIDYANYHQILALDEIESFLTIDGFTYQFSARLVSGVARDRWLKRP